MTDTTWLLLVTNLPGRNQTLRMRIWRALKAAGAAALRDGVYVLPESSVAREVLDEQARGITAGGGNARVLSFTGDGLEQQTELVALFDRRGDYTKLLASASELKRAVKRTDEVDARRRLAVLERERAALAAVDFFPSDARVHLDEVVAEIGSAINARFSPDEPHPTHRPVAARDRKDYRGRVWATRQRVWIDRISSAWLIRRFIDPKARFVWLKRVGDCPKRAVGFDFDGAEFSHVNGKVTFEVLLASFALDGDAALTRLGQLVHYLDVGGVPVTEAAGFEKIVAGARALRRGDDALTKKLFPVLDCLYAGYTEHD